MVLPRLEFGLPTALRGFFALTLFAAFGAAAYVGLRPEVAGKVAPGLTVDGVVPDGDLRAFVAERARLLRERKVALVAVEKGRERVILESTLGAMGVVVDEERAVERAMAASTARGLFARRALAARAASGALDVPLLPTVDAHRAMSVLDEVKEEEDAMPISARLDVERSSVVPERPGRYVDADAVMASLTTLARAPSAPEPLRLTLPVVSFAPRVTAEFVRSVDVGTVLANYETHFSRRGDQERRGTNIEVAASKLDGLVLSPGELVSFNEVVGDRSEENGFQKSWEIFKGEMKEGVGGGTCQVASTVHAAAFFAGIDIVERLPHSRPSAYIPMGLDATVVYPIVDMKLRNSFAFPIVMHAKVDGNTLRVSVLGAKRPAHVSFTRELVKTFPYSRKIEEKTHLSGRKVVVRQHGIRGFRIERERVLTFRNGKKRVEKSKDFYPPTTEIYEVPPGFDVALLPPLPVLDEDEGEGSDTSAQAAAASLAAAAPASSPVQPAACVGDCSGAASPSPFPQNPFAPAVAAAVAPPPPQIRLEDAPGAHAPSTAQAKPTKKLTIKR